MEPRHVLLAIPAGKDQHRPVEAASRMKRESRESQNAESRRATSLTSLKRPLVSTHRRSQRGIATKETKHVAI